MFLTRDELAKLIGCQPSSKSCMCRWLDKNGWPYERNRQGFPNVAKTYYDARMLGLTPAAAPSPPGPDREALLKRLHKNDKTKKVA